MKRRFWSDEDDAKLRALYPDSQSDGVAAVLKRSLAAVYGRAQILGLEKSEAFRNGPLAYRLDGKIGARFRFPKGHVPANKGLRRPGWSPGRMSETQFKRGGANHNVMPIGSERLVDGYRYLKVAAVRYVPYMVNWLPLHILNWERANGRPLPDGHCLWFRDGNRLNVDPANLELITRAENMARNTYHRYPKAVARAIQLRGALNRRINRLERERAEHA